MTSVTSRVRRGYGPPHPDTPPLGELNPPVAGLLRHTGLYDLKRLREYLLTHPLDRPNVRCPPGYRCEQLATEGDGGMMK